MESTTEGEGGKRGRGSINSKQSAETTTCKKQK